MTTIGDIKNILAKLYDLLKDLVELIKKFFAGDDADDDSTTNV